jgi:hypothetical protein
MVELQIQEPDFETCARGYIRLMSQHILKTESHPELFDLANKIFHIVSIELHYPDDLFEWYEISEMIDQYQYGDGSVEFGIEEIFLRIKKQAKIIS